MSQVDDRTYRQVTDFLLDEANLLDDDKFEQWLELLAEDLHYVMPVRSTREKGAGSEVVPETTWYDDTRNSLGLRVQRLRARFPVSEDPPSRTRHFVSNIQAYPGKQADEVLVNSNLLVYRSRGDSSNHELFSAKRTDTLRRENGSFKLAQREILLDQAVVAARNLGVFF